MAVGRSLPDLVSRLKLDTSNLVSAEATASGFVARTAVLFGGLAVAVGAVGVVSTRMAADFQTSITQLVTGAGESRDNIALVSKGILDMASQVGTGATDLAKGMYEVESAGYHGAAGLTVLKAAAEGAKVGGADLTVVANGLTTVLNAYGKPASDATAVTSELVQAVALGKTHLDALTASLGTVLPIAASLHVPFEQVAGAISTMTVQGTDAANATQSLRFLMATLSGPTAAASKELTSLGVTTASLPQQFAAASGELKKLGIHSDDVAKELATGNLQGALQMITDALGKKFPVGSAEYLDALKIAVGGTRGMTAALELTGPHAATWIQNMQSIGNAAKSGGKEVQGWSLVQQDFNFKMQQFQARAEVIAIRLGTALLPILGRLGDIGSSALLPMFSKLADAVTKAADAINGGQGAYGAITAFLVELGVQGTTANQIAAILTGTFQALVNILGFLHDHMNILIPVVAGLTAVYLAFQAAMAISTLLEFGAAFLTFAAEQGVAAAAATALGVAELLALWPIALLVLGIAALIAIIILAVTHTKEIGEAFSWLGTQAQKVWGVIVKDVAGFVGMVVGHITGLWAQIKAVWDRLVSTAEAAWADFSSRPIYWIVFLIASAALLLNSLVEKVQQKFDDLVNLALDSGKNFVTTLLTFFTDLPGNVVVLLTRLLLQLVTWENQLKARAKSAGTSFLTGVTDEVKKLPGQVGDFFQNVLTTLQNQIPLLIQKGAAMAAALVKAILDGLANLPKQIGDKFSSLGGQINSALHDAKVPGFQYGGVVPGQLGQPQLIVAHGGEVITPPNQLPQIPTQHHKEMNLSKVEALLEELVKAVTTPPDTTGVEAALYKAVEGTRVNRLRGMAGAGPI